MLYHPKADGIVEDFNKILENSLMKIYNVNRNDSDMRISVVLCEYQMTYNKLTGKTLF